MEKSKWQGFLTDVGYVRIDGLEIKGDPLDYTVQARPSDLGRYNSRKGIVMITTVDGGVYVKRDQEERFGLTEELLGEMCPNGLGGFVPLSNGGFIKDSTLQFRRENPCGHSGHNVGATELARSKWQLKQLREIGFVRIDGVMTSTGRLSARPSEYGHSEWISNGHGFLIFFCEEKDIWVTITSFHICGLPRTRNFERLLQELAPKGDLRTPSGINLDDLSPTEVLARIRAPWHPFS